LQQGPLPAATHDAFASPAIDDLRVRFLDEARRQLPLWVEQLITRFNAAEAQAIAHQWVGTGGLLGFSRLSLLAQEVETILRQKPLDVSELREIFAEMLKEVQQPTMASQQAAAEPEVQPTTDGPLVVIADDDAYMRALGKALFQSQSIECRAVADGDAALAAIREFRPRAAVLDVDMPGTNGYDVLAALRAEGSRVKVLLLTADKDSETAGADDVLVKPFNPVELVVRVKKWL